MKYTFIKASVIGVTALALAGCVTDQTGVNVATGVSTVVTDVGNVITGAGVLTNAKIQAIQDDVAGVCKFVPAVETVTAIASLFSPAVLAGSSYATPIVNAICGQVQGTTTAKLSLSRKLRVATPVGQSVTVGTVDGVPVTGYYVK